MAKTTRGRPTKPMKYDLASFLQILGPVSTGPWVQFFLVHETRRLHHRRISKEAPTFLGKPLCSEIQERVYWVYFYSTKSKVDRLDFIFQSPSQGASFFTNNNLTFWHMPSRDTILLRQWNVPRGDFLIDRQAKKYLISL